MPYGGERRSDELSRVSRKRVCAARHGVVYLLFSFHCKTIWCLTGKNCWKIMRHEMAFQWIKMLGQIRHPIPATDGSVRPEWDAGPSWHFGSLSGWFMSFKIVWYQAAFDWSKMANRSFVQLRLVTGLHVRGWMADLLSIRIIRRLFGALLGMIWKNLVHGNQPTQTSDFRSTNWSADWPASGSSWLPDGF